MVLVMANTESSNIEMLNVKMPEMDDLEWIFYIMQGIPVTIGYALLSTIFGVFFGLLLALLNTSNVKLFRYFVAIYISIIRGTPLLLQISIVYFALPSLPGIEITAFEAGILALSINASAYLAEIFRAGINSVDEGQLEAAKSLSVPYHMTMIDIILPQAFRNTLPAIVNEIINLVKDSSLIAIIGVADLMRRAQIIAAEQYSYFAPLLVAGACYYVIIAILSLLARRLEEYTDAEN
jgi:His/Glu/Gln/Arg/opine family amino acid ABC transporter permease subunit